MSQMKKKQSGSLCCVVGCTNNRKNSPGTKFYVFPASQYKIEQRNKWIAALKRLKLDGTPWEPSKHSLICSQHFIGNRKSDHPYSPSFIPTIFPLRNSSTRRSEKSIQNSVDRFNRSLKRSLLQKEKLLMAKSVKENNVETMFDEAVTFETDYKSSLSHLDKEVQCYFIEEVKENSKLFVCNRIRDNGCCEAETQTFIPYRKNITLSGLTKSTRDKCCGDDKQFSDACVGPNPTNDENNLLDCIEGFHGYRSIKSDQNMLELAGVNVATFIFLLQYFSDTDPRTKLSKENRLLIFLFKMKLGLTFSTIGVFFNVHRITVSRIFHSLLKEISQTCRKFVQWPSRAKIQSLMPPEFCAFNSNCRVIIDFIEILVEQQSPNIFQRNSSYSHYEKEYRRKVIVGYTPHGQISFVSRTCSNHRDSQITMYNNFLNLLEYGDVVLADKDIPEMKTLMDESGKDLFLVVMPPVLCDESFTTNEIEETQSSAAVRKHMERIMQRLRTFMIMSKFTMSLLAHVDDIIFMCCVLVNLQLPS